jgi:hypothetical protein
MEKSLSLKIGDEHSFQCDGCRSEFRKPLLATDSSRGNVQTYYACPRCLSKVDNVQPDRQVEDRSVSVSVEPAKKLGAVNREVEVNCQHFLGFLKKREKNAAIPDECLTCEKMIECMVR